MSERRPKAGDYIWHAREEFTRIPSWEVRFGDRVEYSENRGWILARCWTSEDAAVTASAMRVHFGVALAPAPSEERKEQG